MRWGYTYMVDYYQILGITEEASQEEIKRAYFRLVRKHSPEKDPEGFRKIREAYEELKKGKREDRPVFSDFSVPMAKLFADQIESSIRYKDYLKARDTAQEAVRLFPKDIYFLYMLMIAQRLCGNSGKAVQNAELLVEREPDNRWFARELAVSYQVRGYGKKALNAFARAYEMGCRDLEFVLQYARQQSDQGDDAQAAEILLELIKSGQKWTKEELPMIRNVYQKLVNLRTMVNNDRELLTQHYLDFLTEYGSFFGNALPDYLEPMMDLLESMEEAASPETWRKLQDMIESLRNTCRDPENRRHLDNLYGAVQLERIHGDPKVCRSLQYYFELSLLESEEEIQKFEYLDSKLCMIEEREKILAEEDYLRNAFPAWYEDIRVFIDSLRNEREAEMLKQRLQKEYRRQSVYYGDGNYYKWYPEEKKKDHGKVKATGEETYIRASTKIGRNDPCPCGSGKKFKKCCMGKGIYDA